MNATWLCLQYVEVVLLFKLLFKEYFDVCRNFSLLSFGEEAEEEEEMVNQVSQVLNYKTCLCQTIKRCLPLQLTFMRVTTTGNG